MLGARRCVILGLIGSVWACGGSTSAGTGTASGGAAGTNADGGSSSLSGGSSSGGVTSSGGISSTGGITSYGGATPSGGATASGGTGGISASGGSATTGGSGGSLTDCTTSYTGPVAGPRLDGPAPLSACSLISDAEILARYGDFLARVPKGLYFEPSASLSQWEDPCSNSLDATVSRSSAKGLGTLEGQYSTDWFYEAVYCKNGVRRAYRNLRCSYFDGSKLHPATDDNLVFLASLLWWRDNGNVSGSAILGYSISIGNATDWVDVCSIVTTFGDFGLCDQITLQNTRDSIRVDGTVELGTPTVVRTIKGQCH